MRGPAGGASGRGSSRVSITWMRCHRPAARRRPARRSRAAPGRRPATRDRSPVCWPGRELAESRRRRRRSRSSAAPRRVGRSDARLASRVSLSRRTCCCWDSRRIGRARRRGSPLVRPRPRRRSGTSCGPRTSPVRRSPWRCRVRRGHGRKPSAMPAATATGSASRRSRSRGSAAIQRGQVAGVGPVEALDLPEPGRERSAPGSLARTSGPAPTRSAAPKTPRNMAKLSETRPDPELVAARSTQLGDHRLDQAVLRLAVAAHQVQREPAPAPRHQRQQRRAASPLGVVGEHRDAVAVDRVAEPAQRHREAALGVVAAPAARRARPARPAVGGQLGVPDDA